jgi:hypothetical protein
VLSFWVNSSINIDESGTAQLRLDADVTDLVGFAQPANCSTITELWLIILLLSNYCLE